MKTAIEIYCGTLCAGGTDLDSGRGYDWFLPGTRHDPVSDLGCVGRGWYLYVQCGSVQENNGRAAGWQCMYLLMDKKEQPVCGF